MAYINLLDSNGYLDIKRTHASPTRPATPSTILTVSKVSK